MGEITYEEQGTYTWLVYELEETEEMDSLSLGMLTKNKVPGILPVVYTPVNGVGFIKYNVSSQVSAKDYLAGMVNREKLLGVFAGIASAMTAAESYMLDVNTLILDMDYIFVDVSTGVTHMICVPIMAKVQKRMDLAGFFRNILFTVQFESSENLDYVTRIVNYLNSTQMFSLMEFGRLVASLRLPVRADCPGDYAASSGAAIPGMRLSSGMAAPAGRLMSPRMPMYAGRPMSAGISADAGMAISPGESAPANGSGEKPLAMALGGAQGRTQQRQASGPAGEFDGMMIPGGMEKREPSREPGGRQKKPGLFDSLKSRRKPAGEQKSGKADREAGDKKKKGKKQAPQDNMSIPSRADAVVPPAPPSAPVIPMTADEMDAGMPYGATADDFDVQCSAALRLLYVTEGGRPIAVTAFPFEIGREGSGLKIDASKTKISRRHAVITQAGSRFFITDFSKHGTFLNGARIPQGEPRVLENGMRVLLKTEEFEVKIE